MIKYIYCNEGYFIMKKIYVLIAVSFFTLLNTACVSSGGLGRDHIMSVRKENADDVKRIESSRTVLSFGAEANLYKNTLTGYYECQKNNSQDEFATLIMSTTKGFTISMYSIIGPRQQYLIKEYVFTDIESANNVSNNMLMRFGCDIFANKGRV